MRSRSVATRSAPTISRKSTAIGWRLAMVSTARSSIVALQLVDLGVGGDDARAERDVPADQRIDGFDDLPFREATHLGDEDGSAPADRRRKPWWCVQKPSQIPPANMSRQPKRPVM